MSIYEEYAKNKLEIKILTERLKEIEPEILKEITNLSSPMKTDLGTFSTVRTETYKLSEAALSIQSELKAKIKEVEKEDIESGKAEKIESVGLRFSITKVV